MDEALAEFARSTLSVSLTIRDGFTPAIKRVAVSMEIMFAQAAGEWNRYQMVGWRRTDKP